MELSDRVKELREQAGLTQEELAEKMGVQRNTVWRWENKKANLRAENIQRLSAVLNIEASDLMNNKGKVNSHEFEQKQGVFPSLAYWGEVADNARTIALHGNSEDIEDVTHILRRALASLTSVSGKAVAMV